MQHAGWNYQHDSPLYMLDFHRDRLLKAARYWQWDRAVDVLSHNDALDSLTQLVVDAVDSDQMAPVRIKILISADGRVTIEKGETRPKALQDLFPTRLAPPTESGTEEYSHQSPTYTVMLDTVPICPSPFTHYKTTMRQMYDEARKRSRLTPTDHREVLVSNKDGNVMEGTIFTAYFWRNGRWITPPVPHVFKDGDGSGGQDGTTRRWALER
jgi:4-amino-4-deoxychorismate lyase